MTTERRAIQMSKQILLETGIVDMYLKKDLRGGYREAFLEKVFSCSGSL